MVATTQARVLVDTFVGKMREWCGGERLLLFIAQMSCVLVYYPVIAQLVEHLTVEIRSDQMVPGSIPGDRICLCYFLSRAECYAPHWCVSN